jgi:beta-lactamase class A
LLLFSRREFLLTASTILPVSCLSARALQTATPTDQLTAIESRLGGRLGVAALDTATGKRVGHRATERFPMCSTFKFLLVASILSRVDRNEEKLDRFIPYATADLLEYAPIAKAHLREGGMTISALCAAAITYSDNTAANLLLNVIGGPAQLTQYARSLGDSVTRLDRNEPTLNTAITGDERDTTSPSSMLGDMNNLLLEETHLTAASRKQLIDWLLANTTGTHSLRAGLPASWQIGDKTGSGKNGATNDIAICWPPNRAPLLITSYFVESTASSEDYYAALAEAGRIVAVALA